MPAASWQAPATASVILTGGDDGALVATDASGQHRVLATDDKHRWIDQVALGPDGAVAWSAGKTAHVRTDKGEARRLDAPSTVAGLAFAPKGFRLAHRALQRRHALVSQRRRRQAGDADLEGLASRRHLQPGRQIPGHHHAGADAARLAARRRPAHAHVGLFGARALALLDARTASCSPPRAPSSSSCGRSTARTARWARQPKMLAPLAGARGRGRLPSAPAGRGGRLCRRHGAAGAHRRRRADPGEGGGRVLVSALGWDAAGQTLAFGTEAGEAGVLTL